VFYSDEKFIFTKTWSSKSVPISIKHADVGGRSSITRIIRDFVRKTARLVDLKFLKRGPRMVLSFCKDHHFGVVVPTVESHIILTPQVHSEVTGTYHGDGLYQSGLGKHSQFLLRSCRTSTGWCKLRLDPYEVMGLYDISDSVTLGLHPALISKFINIQHLTPVNILLSATFTVVTEVLGWGGDLIPERRVKVRQEEELEDRLVQDQAERLGHLGVKGKPFSAQE
jgi:hypothetical protein